MFFKKNERERENKISINEESFFSQRQKIDF
jgi:hypothetical protein